MGTCISYSSMSTDELLNEVDREGGDLLEAIAAKLEQVQTELQGESDASAVESLEDSLEEAQDGLASAESKIVELKAIVKSFLELAKSVEL